MRILLSPLVLPGLVLCLSCNKKSSTDQGVITPVTEPLKEVLVPVTTLKTRNISGNSAIAGGRLAQGHGSVITERGVCWSSSPGPSITGNKVLASTFYSSGDFESELNGLQLNSTYYVRAFATNAAGTSYGAEDTFKTADAFLPTVTTTGEYISGALVLFTGGEVTNSGNNAVIRKGLCWSTNPLPTVANDTTIDGAGLGTYKSVLKNLVPNTVYFVRAYATNAKGTGYGDVVQMRTIPKGNVTYTLVREANPTADQQAAYQRIAAAMDGALYYFNHFTSITKHLTVYYNTGVATADGNINGTIRFGSNSAYQKTGTAMHEISHTVGVGQHSMWTNTLIKNGVYQGAHAQQVMRSMNGDATTVLKGDSQHFWPYGINGSWEDTGDPNLYTIHAMILAGMKKDGLPSN